MFLGLHFFKKVSDILLSVLACKGDRFTSFFFKCVFDFYMLGVCMEIHFLFHHSQHWSPTLLLYFVVTYSHLLNICHVTTLLCFS